MYFPRQSVILPAKTGRRAGGADLWRAIMDVSTDQPNQAARGNFRGLVAILVGIALGVLVGVVYGRQMWLASGGPQRSIERFDATVRQKEAFAQRADRLADEIAAQGDQPAARAVRDEAARLRSHIPVIQTERKRLADLDAQLQQQAANDTIPLLAWEMTQFVGDIFLQVLKLLVIPLVVTSMITGITALGDVRRLGQVGGWTVFYYLMTGASAVLLGIFLVQVIQPGTGADDTFAFVSENVLAKEDSTILGTLLDVFRARKDDPGRQQAERARAVGLCSVFRRRAHHARRKGQTGDRVFRRCQPCRHENGPPGDVLCTDRHLRPGRV